MLLQDNFLEKWQECLNSRYPVLLIVPSQGYVFSETLCNELANLIKVKLLDFAKQHQGKLGTFFTWNKVREIIYTESHNTPLMITNIEPFYSKWPVDERIYFLQNLIRSEFPHGIILILHCQENLKGLSKIEENNRGIIWIP